MSDCRKCKHYTDFVDVGYCSVEKFNLRDEEQISEWLCLNFEKKDINEMRYLLVFTNKIGVALPSMQYSVSDSLTKLKDNLNQLCCGEEDYLIFKIYGNGAIGVDNLSLGDLCIEEVNIRNFTLKV